MYIIVYDFGPNIPKSPRTFYRRIKELVDSGKVTRIDRSVLLCDPSVVEYVISLLSKFHAKYRKFQVVESSARGVLRT